MGRTLSIVERTRKTCYFSRQGSLISQNPPALAVGSMSNNIFVSVSVAIHLLPVEVISWQDIIIPVDVQDEHKAKMRYSSLYLVFILAK